MLEWDHLNYEEEMQLPQYSLLSTKRINTSVVYLIGPSPERASFKRSRVFFIFRFIS